MKRGIIILVWLMSISLISRVQGQSLDNLDKKGLALQGYDPVSYFTANSPQKGQATISYQQESRTYYFASSENKQIFIGNPGKYEPAYGGWCAYAIGLDASKVKIDPETYKIVDGKLFLFYNFFFINTLDKWNEDEVGWKKKAVANWELMMAGN